MCGIIGVYGSPFASFEVYRGLLTLQHRGQDAAGILSYHFQDGRFNLVKKKGLVAEVFNPLNLEELVGSVAIGHTRYSTVGKGEQNDIQPFVGNHPFGLGMCHNGNLVNYFELTEKLKHENHFHPLTSNDLETLLNLFSVSLSNQIRAKNKKSIKFDQIKNAVSSIFEAAKGGYSVTGIIADHGMFAFRDPQGLRPLTLGTRVLTVEEKSSYAKNKLLDKTGFERSYIVSSETVTISFLGYKATRDLLPGELIFIDKEGKVHSAVLGKTQGRPCMFEWVYFSSAESEIVKRPVYGARLELGRGLARMVAPLIKKKIISPDLVLPVPETSRPAAISLAEELKLPYREALIKNRYVQRSFILHSQEQREKIVDIKLGPVRSEIQGKKVLLVDDSIVRGTTSKKIVELVKRAGAKEVYVASTCPPIRHPCFYGVDFPEHSELIAFEKDEKEIAKAIGADHVIYLDQKGLAQAIDAGKLCMACIDGDYPVNIDSAIEFQKKRRLHRQVKNEKK